MFRVKTRTKTITWMICLLLGAVLLSSCAQPAGSCPQQRQADLSQALSFAEDDSLPFQFPLAELGQIVYPRSAVFQKSGWKPKLEYHAAEDYKLPAGSPVYAFADGEISFSGPMGGYGWLIIIDHPWADIYSLYGHLSPSRWKLESGEVKKGDLIGYLGDEDENGGSPENPLRTHLHFGIRVGQRSDYSGLGEWRWMAGWIHLCPTDLGWLKPSQVITNQELPAGGFPKPEARFFEKWAPELILSSFYILAGIGTLVISRKKGKPILPLIYGAVLLAGGGYFTVKSTRLTYVFFSLAALMIVLSVYQLIKGRKERKS